MVIPIQNIQQDDNYSSRMNIDELQVSPNPFTDNVLIRLSGNELNGQLLLTNSLGQVIYRSNNISGNYFSIEIDLEKYGKGIYFLNYNDGLKQITKKIVKI